MNKAVAAGVLLVLLFAAAGWNIRRVDRFTDAVTAQVELSRDFCREDNLSAAASALNAAMDRWREAEPWTHIFLRHGELDAVSDAFFFRSSKSKLDITVTSHLFFEFSLLLNVFFIIFFFCILKRAAL